MCTLVNLACEYSCLSRRFLRLVGARGEGCIRRLEIKVNLGLIFFGVFALFSFLI